MKQAIYKAIQKAIAENRHDAAVRATLLVNGLNANDFLGADEYIYAVDSRSRGRDLIFYTTDKKGHDSEVWVDLMRAMFRSRFNEEGCYWTNWYSC